MTDQPRTTTSMAIMDGDRNRRFIEITPVRRLHGPDFLADEWLVVKAMRAQTGELA